MIRTLIVCSVLLLTSGCANTDEWTRRDTVGQLLVTAALAADAYSTANIQHVPGYY